MGGAYRESHRIDHLFTSPNTRQRIKPIGQRLTEHQDVRRNAEMFNGPQFTGTIKAHLDFIDHQQDAVIVEHFLQALVKITRWDDIAAGALNRFDIERGEFRLLDFRFPNAMIFIFKQAGKIGNQLFSVFFRRQTLWPAERIRERNKLGTVAEVAETATIAIAGRDSRRP